MKAARTYRCRVCREHKGAPAFVILSYGRRDSTCRACRFKRQRELAAWRKRGRKCPRCGKRARCPEEIGVSHNAVCRACRQATKNAWNRTHNYPYVKRWRQARPEWKRDENRRYRERTKADPKRRERKRAVERERRRRVHARSLVAPYYVDPDAPAREDEYRPLPKRAANHLAPLLDAGPLAEWLRFEFQAWPTYLAARRLHVDEAVVRRLITGEQRRVSLHIADRMLVSADCTHLLALLYPDEEVAA